MGADLCIAYIILPKEISLDKLEKRLLEKIDEVKEDDLDFWECFKFLWEDAYCGEFDDDKHPLEVVSGGEYKETRISLSKAKSIFKEIVENTFEALTGARDVTRIIHKGDTIFISGGMSWGDSPTQNYDTFGKFNFLEDWKEYKEILKSETLLREIEK